MNLLLIVISTLVISGRVASGTSLWDLMPTTLQRQTRVKQPAPPQSRGSQGGFWGQILQHSKEGQTQGEKYSSQNSERLVTIASESVRPAGSQNQRKNIPESLRSLHTIYTDYDEDYDDYYDDEYYEQG